ncbi:hypothetical protein HYDPIDRAFT_166842 [Hydnomerulius pinastri MD-312]|nr:hypothetical protein HYDPIDRAFT_166842 [Hydnomerulius pinastri MD-312]
MLTVQCFYDGPRPRTNPFAEFIKIEHKTVSGGGDTVGHESLPASRTLNTTISNQYSGPRMAGPVFWQPEPKEPLSDLQEYSSYEEFDQQFSLINEMLDTQTIQPVSQYSGYISSASGTGSNAAPVVARYMESLAPQAPTRIKRPMVGIGENPRGRWGNVMVDVYTKPVIDEIARQASRASRQMLNNGGKRVVIDIWPFTETMFNNSTPSAWPHDRGSRNGPILAYFIWEGSENDRFWLRRMDDVLTAIKAKVDKDRAERAKHAEGAEGAELAKALPVYSNTTLVSTNVSDIYGDNFDTLKGLRARFDPDRVMDRAGSGRFKIPFSEEDSTNEEGEDDDGLYD